MKKLIIVSVIVALLVAVALKLSPDPRQLFAEESPTEAPIETVQEEQPVPEPTPEPTPEPAPEPTPEPVPEPVPADEDEYIVKNNRRYKKSEDLSNMQPRQWNEDKICIDNSQEVPCP